MSARTLTFLTILLMLGGWTEAADQRVETFRFDYTEGDTLVVENDFGRVRLASWERNEIEVTARVIVAESPRLENVSVACSRVGGRVFARTFFYEYQAESVYLDVQAPAGLNTIIWGANPAVELSGFSGYVRASTLTGLISAENLSGSVTLQSQDGSIRYRAGVQPSGDVHLDSVNGGIDCDLLRGLNVRSWMRAGGRIDWNGELEMSEGFLERQVGVGGPLLAAASVRRDVIFRLRESLPSLHGISQSSSDGTGRDSSQRKPVVQGHIPADAGGTDLGTPDEYGSARSVGVTEDSSGGGYRLRVNVDWVYVNASVRDEVTNRAVADLDAADFVLREDGVVQEIDRFESTEAPFHLMILLDVSGSTESFIDDVRHSAIQFTREIQADDQVGVATFNSRTRLRQDFTNDREAVRRAISGIRSGGGTALYDALDLCVNRYMANIEGRKAVVVFSDGEDNQLTGDYEHGSVITYPDLYRAIQEKDTLIYTVFLENEGRTVSGSRRSSRGVLADIILGRTGRVGGRSARAEALRQMEEIADQTGGRFYRPQSVGELSDAFAEIASDLRIQYTLGYISQNPARDGRWREIELEVRDRPDLVVRSRRGYYAGRN